MATCEEIGNDINAAVSGYSNFKIGKTGQTLDDRFSGEYEDDYSYIRELGSSKDPGAVDDCEEYLIERFMDYDNCDNEQVGGGEMTDSDEYRVYLVYNV